MTKFRDIKVVIRSPDGHYLTGDLTEWEFTNNLAEAGVFNYLGDGIETQLAAIEKSQGLVLDPIHFASHELQETCDRCEVTVLPTDAFFNGMHFLCPDCSGYAQQGFAA